MRIKGKLKFLKEHIKEIEGQPLVHRKWVVAVLSKSQLKQFEKSYSWVKDYKRCLGKHRCNLCRREHGIIHVDMRTFHRYAKFWNLEKFLDSETRYDI